MAQELKIRISNHKEVAKKLEELGATFVGEENFTDTYFTQPKGVVLKISTTSNRSSVLNLNSVDGKFEIISNEKIENIENAKKELSKKYGIKATLKGKRRFYMLNDLKITIYLIENLGEFLILTGANPAEEFITKNLGIKNPNYVKVSFDELRRN